MRATKLGPFDAVLVTQGDFVGNTVKSICKYRSMFVFIRYVKLPEIDLTRGHTIEDSEVINADLIEYIHTFIPSDIFNPAAPPMATKTGEDDHRRKKSSPEYSRRPAAAGRAGDGTPRTATTLPAHGLACPRRNPAQPCHARVHRAPRVLYMTSELLAHHSQRPCVTREQPDNPSRICEALAHPAFTR
ncbi:hypothetical protein STAS_19439 [Striga asiatica]|uniref:Uncharacterized protein n=1 Tax=Striga asiatica TaxID=4170 RepID=A0A5A7QBP9_STRAF|nr:hypothetical protein STAS_19439 [Striga asiatica]